MSKKKKHKKKFNAQLHQALQEMQRDEVSTEEQKNLRTEEQKSVPTPRQEVGGAESRPESVGKFGTPKVDDKKETEKVSDEYNYVKKDVLKIVMIVAICIVLLVAIWILSLKTNYISNFANSLANFSHLSQGK